MQKEIQHYIVIPLLERIEKNIVTVTFMLIGVAFLIIVEEIKYATGSIITIILFLIHEKSIIADIKNSNYVYSSVAILSLITKNNATKRENNE